ncbi:MAG: DegT/DnrJ/EryC1/StrS aminotransferase family protein [Candidatus Omnitrophica bacterium]|nr:DegT/DnrJ/EryC1/StrS aminotransferase family protein [Candidatus Omnitrophota bacterium]
MIPIARPSIGEDELTEIKKVFASGWLGMGSVVFEFENAIKGYLGVKYIIAVNTGTSALHIALDALNLETTDEVIVPSLTFVASIQTIIAAGARPVFCDIDPNTLNMDIEDVKRRITSRTKVIMPVHYGGLPCDMEALLDIAKNSSVRIVEDAAHAFGSSYKGKRIGAFGDITCFSFDPIKNLTCGEGGAVVVNDEDLAAEIMRKRILGIDKDTWQRYKNKRSWVYEVVTTGFRYHMSNINAAIGLAQIKKLDRVLEKKRQIIREYDNAFKGMSGIELLYRDYRETAPFNYVIKVKNNKRDKLLDYLNKNGVGAGINYIPNHIQPLFKDFKVKLPVTEMVWQEIISLPLYFDMTQTDVTTVIEQVKKFFAKK